MDIETLRAYDRSARAFAEDWEDTQSAPTDLHALIRRFFAPGPTADIGCGSGRDTAWLTGNGFPATGYDASEGLLAEARRRHPEAAFQIGPLPDLADLAAASFTNVLCETVIMHLKSEEQRVTVFRLVDILEPAGTLYLSWRVTEGEDRRDDQGRLYAAVDAAQVRAALSGTKILFDEESESASSGKKIHRIIARKL